MDVKKGAFAYVLSNTGALANSPVDNFVHSLFCVSKPARCKQLLSRDAAMQRK
jgi:hypothetical protein